MRKTKFSFAIERNKNKIAEKIAEQQILARRNTWHSRPFWHRVLKRAMDTVGSLSLFIALSPLMLLTALLIKLTDGGPVIFWQKRVGKWGHVFSFPKCRSMVVHAETMQAALQPFNDHGVGSVTFKMKKDPRLTWVGRYIRQASIDELPQLWCVLRGDMSLVGPRPPLPEEVTHYSLNDRRRLDIEPGLTCFWQVKGRSAIPFPQQVELDVDYIENPSLEEDFKLLAKTLPAVIKGNGAS